MINYNDAFNSAKLIPGAHRYLPGWKTKSKAFRAMMSDQSKSQIDVIYDEETNLSMDVFSPGPYVEATVIFLYGGLYGQQKFLHFLLASLAALSCVK